MKNNMKLNNKGFSLVELIVVIAIMAILVGVLAPSVLGQLDKAKIAKDKQAIDSIASAVAIAYADQDISTNKPSTTGDITISGLSFGTATAYAGTSAPTTFDQNVLNMVGYSGIAFESNAYKGKTPTININVTTGKVTVTIDKGGSNEYSIIK